jgi:hypothetical protein
MSKEYAGIERRSRCEDCVVNSNKLTELEVRHEMVLENLSSFRGQLDKLTNTLDQTNVSLHQVCLALAEQQGARKIALLIASAIGSALTFAASYMLDKVAHK